ncbi:MAG: hypothetical protein WAS73_16360 [Defluviicoccus sp.]
MTGRHQPLPEIPLLQVGADWPFETLVHAFERANALLDEGSRRFPGFAIRAADALSRRWLERWHEPYLAEVDRIAARIGRPGAYFLNVSYEWGCTSRAGPSPDGRSAQLTRVLDWPDRGLGRHVIAAVVDGAAGPWLTMTWPGYTGVLQAVAPRRFAAALNQAPMQKPVGFYPLDWLVTRLHVWDRPHLTAAHLLRQVFERARTFAEAKALLVETPIALPAIYILAGLAADEACVIERQPECAHVIEGDACAANAWQATAGPGRARGHDNAERVASLRSVADALDGAFEWLRPPVLNRRTRLAFVADASSGSAIAQGLEMDGPATAVLRWGPPPEIAREARQ